jgi:hypothetical protein
VSAHVFFRGGTRARCRTASERGTCAFMVWFQVSRGEPIRLAVSRFAIVRAVRRLERSGALVRSPGTPSGFAAGPLPDDVARAFVGPPAE